MLAERAASLLDIEESASLLFNVLLPRLVLQHPLSQDFDSTLHEITEEWRHIGYHILNTALFDLVVEREKAWESVDLSATAIVSISRHGGVT